MTSTKIDNVTVINEDNGNYKYLEEKVIDGPKGLTLKIYIKTNKLQTKCIAKSNPDGKYVVINVLDKQKTMKEGMTLDKVAAEFAKFSKDNNLKMQTISEFIKQIKEGGGYKHPKLGRAQIGSVKSLKKSRKVSRKLSRKASKKSSRKSKKSRKSSRKSSKKSRRISRKH